MTGTPTSYLTDRSHTPGIRHISPDDLPGSFTQLGKHLAVSSGRFEIRNGCHVRDLDWNHMDQHHRPWIHRTYKESLRIATTADTAVSVTKMRIAGIPFFIQVTDVRIKPGLFFQSFTLLGIFFVHVMIQARPIPPSEGEACASQQIVDWYIVSHRLFRPLHRFLNARIEKLNRVQNEEDREIRDRRAELRNRGYGFSSDEPDFISSNSLTLNTRPPSLPADQYRVAVPGKISRERQKLLIGSVELLVRRDALNVVVVWPAACPHEGADLSKACESEAREITCHWHGLRFHGVVLTDTKPEGVVGLLGVRLEGEELVVWQAVDPGEFCPAAVRQEMPLFVDKPPIVPPAKSKDSVPSDS